MFSDFFIDLREIETETRFGVGKAAIVLLFEQLLSGDPASASKLKSNIQHSTNKQYKVGI